MPDVAATEPLYREEQRFRLWWVWLIVIGVVALAWWSFVWQVLLGRPFGSNPGPDWLVILVFVLVGLGLPALMWAARLITVVTATELVLNYVPFRRRCIARGDIERAEAIEYRPIRDCGGWGIRWCPGRGWAYNVSGDRGVLLDLQDGKKLLVGSQRAEELAEVLTRS